MLAAGKRLGPYEILDPIGAGAMGEVYRARDERLQRDVAVKILPDSSIADPERLRRFELEARAAGRLNHPNILAIHDVGTHNGTPYLVSELLEGQTLRERLDSGPLPVRRAVELAIQIAEGLAAAHEHGITHRDLKPENVFLTREGRIKILDFGLAKLTRPEGAGVREGISLAGSLTGTGMILGTAGYMAPEQVLGEHADHRSDLFAFGTILYEMLSGRRAFKSGSGVETMAAILNAEPDPMPSDRSDVPPALDRIIRHCLEKDPARRFQTAQDLIFNLNAALDAPASREERAVNGAHRGAAGAGRERLAWAVAGGLLVAAVLAVSIPRFASRPGVAPIARFSLAVPEAATVNRNAGEVTISPDGRTIAFVGNDSSSVPHLWIRPIDSLTSRMLAGTAAAYLPFWSPDSRFLAFFANGKLLRIPAAGGPVEDVCDAPSGRGGTWNRQGVIVFAPQSAGVLCQVSASGGEPVAITTLDSTRRETGHRFPQFLPDGRRFLFASFPSRHGNFDISVAELGSKGVRKLLTFAATPIYAAPGWLLFSRNGLLMAHRFDAAKLRLHGEPVPIGDATGYSTYDSEPAASASATGVLAFPDATLPNTEIAWFDLEGRRTGTVAMPEGHYDALRISPDGRRVAVERRNSAASSDIWIAEPERGVARRFVFEPGRNIAPVWSPDGDAIAYSSNRGGAAELFVRRLSGSGRDESLPNIETFFKAPLEWSQDGRTLVVQTFDHATSWDLWSLSLEGERRFTPILQGLANEGPAQISPDGRWLAYASDQSGNSQYYVQPFPGPGERYQLSMHGTYSAATVPSPVWLRGGKEFAFVGPDGHTLMVASVIPDRTFRATTPRRLFKLPEGVRGITSTPDGSRLLATVPSGGAERGSITLVMNWASQIER